MIRTESITHGEVELVRHFSDQNVRIRQIETGVIYDDAIDVVPCRFTYEETDEPITGDDLEAEEALRIITGEPW